MKRDLPEGVIFNARTKNQHVSEIEAAIRVVKERTRGVKNILPYTLAPLLLMWLVAYVTTMLNWVPVKTLSERVSSNVVMFGRKCNAETDLSLQFGQYVETHDHDMITNTLKSRTTPSIALMPVGNLQGSWWFLPLVDPLGSAKPVRRDRWTEIPMPDSALAALNAWSISPLLWMVVRSSWNKLSWMIVTRSTSARMDQLELPLMQSRHLMQWNYSQMSLSRGSMNRLLKVDLVKVDSPTTRWFVEQPHQDWKQYRCIPVVLHQQLTSSKTWRSTAT